VVQLAQAIYNEPNLRADARNWLMRCMKLNVPPKNLGALPRTGAACAWMLVVDMVLGKDDS